MPNESNSSKFWKWLSGIAGSVIAAVIIFLLTRPGGFINPDYQHNQNTPRNIVQNTDSTKSLLKYPNKTTDKDRDSTKDTITKANENQPRKENPKPLISNNFDCSGYWYTASQALMYYIKKIMIITS